RPVGASLLAKGGIELKASRASSLLQKTKRPEPLGLATRQRRFSETSLFDRLPPVIRFAPGSILLVLPDAVVQARHAVGVVEQAPARGFDGAIRSSFEDFAHALFTQRLGCRYHLRVSRTSHGADQRVVRRIHRRGDKPLLQRVGLVLLVVAVRGGQFCGRVEFLWNKEQFAPELHQD